MGGLYDTWRTVRRGYYLPAPMQGNDTSFHHPAAFWAGCIAIVLGVLSHVPMFMMGADNGYRMAGMPMDNLMLSGMAMIPAGLLLAAYGLMPRFAQECGAAAMRRSSSTSPTASR